MCLQGFKSFYDCAVREVKEETGLDVFHLKSCGVVHSDDYSEIHIPWGESNEQWEYIYK